MSVWPDGWGRIVVQRVGSTFDEARLRLGDCPVPFWLMAHEQTDARGRRGRRWEMPAGNFAATVSIHAGSDAARAAQRSFVMSLALYRTFCDVSGRPEAFALKWPNDVLLRGGKVAGILLENSSVVGGRSVLMIGVGVNLAGAPERNQLEARALRPVSLDETLGVSVLPEDFLGKLAAHFCELETQYVTLGFAPIRLAWLAQAARLGEQVIARTGSEEISGIFEDVDDEGQLVLRGARGLRKIAAADVYF